MFCAITLACLFVTLFSCYLFGTLAAVLFWTPVEATASKPGSVSVWFLCCWGASALRADGAAETLQSWMALLPSLHTRTNTTTTKTDTYRKSASHSLLFTTKPVVTVLSFSPTSCVPMPLPAHSIFNLLYNKENTYLKISWILWSKR